MKKLKIDKIAHVTNASVSKCTGKNWDDWIAILEKNGARALTHKEIVALIHKKYKKISTWWRHEVTSGFEIHIGRKLPGRNAKGLFSTTSVKTLPFSQKFVWQMLCSAEGQSAWLKPLAPIRIAPKNSYEVEGGIFGEVRTMLAPKRLRMTWQDTEWSKATFVHVYVNPRSKTKCMLIIMHDSITTSAIKEDLKSRWIKGIEDFTEVLKNTMGAK